MKMTRRGFIKKAGLVAASFATSGLVINLAFAKKDEIPEDEVSPAEDLMREHGVLERLLLIYEDFSRRLQDSGSISPDISPAILLKAIRLNRDFIENYHEKLEEDYLFPRLIKAGKEVQLVNTLLSQHQAGRQLTDNLLQFSVRQILQDSQTRQATGQMLTQYIRMYRPHASREDTVLFPAFKEIVPERDYKELGEQFEKKEHQLFGEDGFHQVVAEITELEKHLGLYDLAQFTPPL